MRLVIATLLPEHVEAVRQALAEVHVTRLSIADAHAYEAPANAGVAQVAVMEVAVNEDFLDRTVSTIAAALTRVDPAGVTGVHVLPIAETVQIYRAVRGQEAI